MRKKTRKLIVWTIVIVLSAVIGFLIAKEQVKREKTNKFDLSESKVIERPIPTLEVTTQKNYTCDENVYRYETVIYKKLIAKHTINNPKSSFDRNKNMKKAADIINNATSDELLKSKEKISELKLKLIKKYGKKGYLVLMPNEIFSWLKIVGNPTESRGFKKSGEIINGKPSSGWGGGVCQVSSTIYSAIYKTKIKKDKKHLYAKKHSVESSYIKPQQGDKEATVTFTGNIDFRFQNTLKNPILLKINVKADKVTSKIYVIEKKKIEL